MSPVVHIHAVRLGTLCWVSKSIQSVFVTSVSTCHRSITKDGQHYKCLTQPDLSSHSSLKVHPGEFNKDGSDINAAMPSYSNKIGPTLAQRASPYNYENVGMTASASISMGSSLYRFLFPRPLVSADGEFAIAGFSLIDRVSRGAPTTRSARRRLSTASRAAEKTWLALPPG